MLVPTALTIRAPDAVLRFEQGAVPDRGLPGSEYVSGVLRVECFDPPLRDRSLGRLAGVLVPAVVDKTQCAVRIPDPDEGRYHDRELAELLLAEAQRSLG